MPIDFKKLIAARFLFTFGVQMQAVVVGWRIYDLLQKPIYLGLVGLAEAVPALGLALFAGHIVDHGRPLKIYRRVLLVSFLSGLLVFLVHAVPDLHDHQVLVLYASSVLTGVARAFSQPTIYAAVPRMVERDKLSKGAAWMSSSMQIARIAGPAFGGIIFGFVGATTATALIAIFLFGAAAVLSTLSTLEMQVSPTAAVRLGIRESLFSGVKFVFGHPILLPALVLDMLSVFFGGVTALLPIFAKEILLVGPKGLGLLRAAPAAGSAIMGIYLARKDLGAGAGKLLLWSVAGFGIGVLIFGLSTNFYLSLFALFAAGVFDSVSMVVRGSAVQLASPDNMRGRIAAVNSMFIGSSNELGELESGVMAQLMGTVNAVIFGALACLVTVGAIAWKSPTLRKMDLKKL